MDDDFLVDDFKLYTPPEQVVVAVSREHQIEAIFSTGGIQFKVGREFIAKTGQGNGVHICGGTSGQEPLVRFHPGDAERRGIVAFDLDVGDSDAFIG